MVNKFSVHYNQVGGRLNTCGWAPYNIIIVFDSVPQELACLARPQEMLKKTLHRPHFAPGNFTDSFLYGGGGPTNVFCKGHIFEALLAVMLNRGYFVRT